MNNLESKTVKYTDKLQGEVHDIIIKYNRDP